AAARIARLGGHQPPPADPLRQAPLAEQVTGGWTTTSSDAVGDGGPPQGSRIPAGGSLGAGLLVSIDALRRLACDASVSLVVNDDENEHPAADDSADLGANPLGIRPGARRADPLYVGRAARIVTAAQWRALAARDRHCVVKGCRRPPLHCEAHHVRHWLDGGPTDLNNLVLLCFQHHHEHHDRGRDLQHRDGRWITSTGWGAQAPP
ncbi:MAG: HNH endonuclease signature motif containing protein, partial [Actinomycetes bacterium]